MAEGYQCIKITNFWNEISSNCFQTHLFIHCRAVTNNYFGNRV